MENSEGHIDIEFGGADFDKVFEADIEHFVRLCNDAGDRMTVRTVKSDDILMGLLRTLRRHGRAEGKAETLASNDGVREAQHLLKIEQRHAEKLGQDLERQRVATIELIRQRDDANAALRDEISEMRTKVALSPGTRVDTLQKALRERTRQAREAGDSAKRASRRSEALEAEMSDLRLRLERQQVNMASEVKLHEANRVIELMKVKLRRIHDLSNPGGN